MYRLFTFLGFAFLLNFGTVRAQVDAGYDFDDDPRVLPDQELLTEEAEEEEEDPNTIQDRDSGAFCSSISDDGLFLLSFVLLAFGSIRLPARKDLS